MSYNTIKVKKYNDVIEEFVAASTITPGMLVEPTSTGTIKAHDTAGANQMAMFALEDELQGGLISDDYSALDQVQVWVAGRGDMVYGILVTGQNVTAGAYLVSNGDGKLKALADFASVGGVETLEVVGQATEAVNASAADKRIVVRIY